MCRRYKTFHGAPRIWGGDGQPAYISTPVIPGHEFYGQVVALGEGAGKVWSEIGRLGGFEQIIPAVMSLLLCEGNTGCVVHNIYGFQKE